MKTSVSVRSLVMPAADIGPSNPLPDLKTVQYVHSGVTVGPHLNDEERKRIGYGMVKSILPYKIQDGYTREKKLRSFRAVIIENDYLKATFLPEIGGRLWSLYNKAEQRELLHVNPVFQPCHLALRNAWFSGGVEWNVGIKGHTPYTCDPLHAEIVEDSSARILRMYEYERIRRCVYCIEAYLPDDSDLLYIKTRISNTAGETVPMYWWSNIAVNETNSTRVIAPAEDALECYYNGDSYWLDKVSMPVRDGVDCSYPANLGISTDFFHCVPKDSPKWICAVEKDGKGLFEASTANMTGKKVFQWGAIPGGRHWQEFLSVKGSAYLEIQSGLARTQLEHIPMESGETWEFVEAYGMISGDCGALFSTDYSAARREAQAAVAAKLRGRTPDDMQQDEVWKKLSVSKGEYINTGSGWGALENKRRRACGQRQLSEYCSFPDSSLTEEQSGWLRLLENGDFGVVAPQQEPVSFMADKNWTGLLAKTSDWYGLMQYGVALYGEGRAEEAMSAFRSSYEARENGWSCRNIAQLERLNGNTDEAEKWLARAAALLEWDRHIWGEYMDLLNSCGKSLKALEVYDTMPADVQAHPRLVFQKIIALCRAGRPCEAQELLDSGLELPDIREGEASLAAVWEEVQRAREAEGQTAKPIPYELDFRMH